MEEPGQAKAWSWTQSCWTQTQSWRWEQLDIDMGLPHTDMAELTVIGETHPAMLQVW